MAQIQQQRILVLCNQPDEMEVSSIYGVYFSLFLQKEVCFFASYTTREERELMESRTSKLARAIRNDMPSLAVSTLVLKGKLHQIMPQLAEKEEAILMCCSGKMTGKLLKAFYNSTIPFLFCREGQALPRRFAKVVIPLDFRNCSKDSTLWGSYLGRFNGSEILFWKANEGDKYYRAQVNELELFVRNLYDNLPVRYVVTLGKGTSWGIHEEALRSASEIDLLIVTGSLNVSLLDYIAGPFEKRLVNSSKETPILLVNPQRDQCILCD